MVIPYYKGLSLAPIYVLLLSCIIRVMCSIPHVRVCPLLVCQCRGSLPITCRVESQYVVSVFTHVVPYSMIVIMYLTTHSTLTCATMCDEDERWRTLTWWHHCPVPSDSIDLGSQEIKIVRPEKKVRVKRPGGMSPKKFTPLRCAPGGSRSHKVPPNFLGGGSLHTLTKCTNIFDPENFTKKFFTFIPSIVDSYNLHWRPVYSPGFLHSYI